MFCLHPHPVSPGTFKHTLGVDACPVCRANPSALRASISEGERSPAALPSSQCPPLGSSQTPGKAVWWASGHPWLLYLAPGEAVQSTILRPLAVQEGAEPGGLEHPELHTKSCVVGVGDVEDALGEGSRATSWHCDVADIQGDGDGEHCQAHHHPLQWVRTAGCDVHNKLVTLLLGLRVEVEDSVIVDVLLSERLDGVQAGLLIRVSAVLKHCQEARSWWAAHEVDYVLGRNLFMSHLGAWGRQGMREGLVRVSLCCPTAHWCAIPQGFAVGSAARVTFLPGLCLNPLSAPGQSVTWAGVLSSRQGGCKVESHQWLSRFGSQGSNAGSGND